MEITKDIRYVGVNDREIDLFEGQFEVENGMAYNSYVISDDKTAVMDSVDARFGSEWIENIKTVLGSAEPDYLVVQHMEPDHSGSILKFMETYKNSKLVLGSKAAVMMKQFFGTDFADRQIIISDGDKLNLGRHELNFVAAPMVHWPEVIMSYDSFDKVIFSADAFGKFGTLDTDEDWACEARRYYFGIVGKYGMQVQNVLKKLNTLEISTICPLHGPIICENPEYYINLYNTWSSYGVESYGVAICYTSVYGGTEKAAKMLAAELEKSGVKAALSDLARCDMAEAVEDAFRYGKLVLATTTYNNDIFPFMRTFIDGLLERNYQNRTIAFIENGTWAPTAAKVMRGMFEKSKNITFAENGVRIMSAMNETNEKEIKLLAEELR